VPKWPSFWDEVAMKAWWDLATLVISAQLIERKFNVKLCDVSRGIQLMLHLIPQWIQSKQKSPNFL
jgi:hypothetical protein